MTKKQNRRDFLKIVGIGSAAASTALYAPYVLGKSKKKVVVVGGGIGGATAAKYIKMMDSSIDVTLIEANKNYYTCFLSNEVLSGRRDIKSIKFGYNGLKKRGINVVFDTVKSIDANGRSVKTMGGKSFAYDRCIVSPGVGFKWEQIEGYDEKVASSKIPHAWKAGHQTTLLRNQLKAMKNGGTVIIAPPPNPFRCPPGPYERASQIAHYLKNHKPKSKVLVLDAKDKFSKFGLFTDGWKRHYGYGTDNSLIEWVPANKGGKVNGVNAKEMVVTGEVEDFKGDVINVIPAQKAGKIAFDADLTNEKGWCPIQGNTFESTKHKFVHVIGDSAIASPLPKSGYAANSEAKVCAAAVVALLSGMEVPDPSYVNTCYSIIAPKDGISVAMVYAYKDGKIVKVKGSGGLTPSKFDAKLREREEKFGHTWFNNITHDTFG